MCALSFLCVGLYFLFRPSQNSKEKQFQPSQSECCLLSLLLLVVACVSGISITQQKVEEKYEYLLIIIFNIYIIRICN